MKVQKSSFKTESACQTKMSESLVEGRLSLPAEKTDIERVLLIQGKVHINAEPADGKVFMDGDVKFSVVYMDIEGNIDSYESSSPFRHSEDIENAGADMKVYAKGGVKEIEYTVEDSRAVYVKGVVSMSIRGIMLNSHEAVCNVDEPDIQTKMFKQRLSLTKEYRKETAVIREDLRVPQSMPKAQKILYADAYAAVKSVRTEELKIVVEGEIRMMLLYLSEDKSAPLQYFYESLPFGKILSTENISADDMVMADADLFDMNIEVADEESDIFRMYAKINIVCMVKTGSDIEFMQDAYSLKNKIDVEYKDYSYRYAALSGCVKAIARCPISIPESEPSVSRVVCLKACPVIATAKPSADRIYLDGLMMFTVCYASSQGMWSYRGEAPFEAEVQMEGIKSTYDIEAVAEVEYCSFEGAGRDINVKFMMDVDITAYTQKRFRLMSEAAESGESAPVKKGITIYFADDGEKHMGYRQAVFNDA